MTGYFSAAWRRSCALLATVAVAMVSVSSFADTGQTNLRINVRQSADITTPIVTTLAQGAKVDIVEYDGEFAKVRTADGDVGYLKSKYLTITKDAPKKPKPAVAVAPQPAPAPAPAPVTRAPAPAPAPAPASDSVEEIVVTGSRIVRKDLTANSPIAIFDAEDLKLSNSANVEEFLRDMPQFVAGIGSNTNNGNPGVATVDLRNLGEERTLVLVDGKRFVAYDADGAVDLSMIPIALIERVEVITGGASAVYGSDAVAGVVNFIMKKNFQGVETDLSYQITEQGDGARRDVSVSMGGNIADGRGNAVLSFSYTDQDQITQGDRAFSLNTLDNTLMPVGSFTTPWGTLLGSFPTVDTAGEGLVQFDQQGNATLVPTLDTFNFNPFNLLQAPQQKWTGTALANFDVTDKVSAYGRISLANSRVDTVIAPTGTFFFPFQLNIDNPFLSQQAQNVFAQQDTDNDGLVDITFGRRLVELGTRDSLFENTTFQIVSGLQGEWRDTSRWEIFGQYGRTTRIQNFQNDVNFANAQQSLLGVDDGNGGVACQDPSNGCVAGNFFGPGLLSAEAADFIRLNIQENNNTEQFIYGGSLTGDTGLRIPSADSPVAYAVGVEYREENSQHLPDDNYANGNAIGFGSSNPIDASIEIREIYGELSVPVHNRVTLEAGIRYAEYDNESILGAATISNSFDNTSFKLAGEWLALDSLRVRGGFQRAVRAPNLAELGEPLTPSTGDLTSDPCEGQNPVGDAALTQLCIDTGVPANNIGSVVSIVSGQINNFVGGNPNLTPEEADSYTVGFVYTPDGIPLTLALDYFQIEITDAIEQISEQNIINACYQVEQDATAPFCSLIARNPLNGGLVGGTETGVDVSLVNAGTTTREGIDLAAQYGLQLGAAGTLDLGIALTYILDSGNQEADQFAVNDCTGLVGSTCLRPEPEIRFVQNTTWSNGPWSVNLRWQFLDEVRQDAIVLDGAAVADFAVPKIDAQHYFDLSGTFALNENYSFRAGIFNLLDEEPPVVGNSYGGTAENSGNTFPATYDPLGRTFGVGFNAKF